MQLGTRIALALSLGFGGLVAEDLTSIEQIFRKADPALDSVRVVARQQMNQTYSALLVQAASTKLPELHVWMGLFIVSGATNQVKLVLDTSRESDLIRHSKLDSPAGNSVCAHFYSDYGLYNGSIKYFYDLASAKPPVKIPYRMLALTSAVVKRGALVYSASAGDWRLTVTIEPRGDGELPGYGISEAPDHGETSAEPTEMRTANGESIIVANQTPPGQQHQVSGVYIVSKLGRKDFFPVPAPSLAFYKKTLPTKQPPGEIENDIGPFAFDGRRIWFASSFYDGEGVSSVGAIGSFDVATRKYNMRYLPEIAPWSGSALRLDGDDLWMGLMRRPEGANYGVGLLRYNIGTGGVRKYAVADLIYTIDRLNSAIYCGTSNGLYIVQGDRITQLRFEPDAHGKLTMFSRQIR